MLSSSRTSSATSAPRARRATTPVYEDGVHRLGWRRWRLSEKVVVDRRWIHKIGNIPLDEAALIEPLSVAHHAVVRSGAESGNVAIVGGAGPIGLLVAAVLKGLGVTTIVTELSEARKAKALSSGVADYVIDPTTEDVKARVLELSGGIGADIGFECAGVNAVLDTMLDTVRPAGVVVNVSIWGKPATIDMQKLVLKEIDLRGTIATYVTMKRSSRWSRTVSSIWRHSSPVAFSSKS